MKVIYAVLALLLISVCTKADDIIKSVGEQLIKKDKILNGRFPVYTEQGKWTFSEKPNWFSGFTAGELWYMYDMTGNKEFKERALKHADNLNQYAELDNTHDLGFIFLNSCVKAYEHTGDIKYRDAAVKAAAMLVRRFNERGNFIRAWGKLGSDDRAGLMIMDTMMNLELLFWAAKETGDYKYYDIAYKHALTCLAQHVRNNYSAYHVVVFDPSTGKVIKKRTHQGYSDESTWARGQAWGIYGFAIAYRYTHNEKFMNASEKLAEYFMNKLPEDLVPYWDLDLKGDNVVRDASAAAIAASGMYLMSELASDKDAHIKYRETADRITSSLKNNYTFLNSKRETEEGILLHTVYNYAKNWGIDESFPCGDFYFTECLYKEYSLLKQDNLIEIKKGRQDILINKDWYYLEDNLKEESSLYQSAVKWEKVNLPHTWNRFDALDQVPGYRRDAGWYEKEIYIPETINDEKIVLYFEGVNLNCEIYVNGVKAGGHTGGFTGFETDITGFIKKGAKNLIRVRADNSYDINIVPSQKSDFVVYGGITRNVWLCVRPEMYLAKMLIQTPAVTEKKAEVKITFIIPGVVKAEGAEVQAVIKDPDGKIVSRGKAEPEKGDARGVITMKDIKNPKLWLPDSPSLYTAELTLTIDGKIQDQITDRFGCRYYEFRDKGAFYLNGKRLLLKGTHRHEELSGLGNALPDSVHRNDIKMIKEMGANFVRLAHYPQAPEVYRACDEIGLLVWDENPWCRGGMGGNEWQANTKSIFREMILQNYNHPSIILWSIGNESDWMPDFPGGDNPDSLKAFASVLNKLAKELDPYRYTTARKFPQAAGVVDVFSPSIWSGWYSDIYSNYEKSLKKAFDTYPRIFHAEYGGDSHKGRHSENPNKTESGVNTSGGDESANKVNAGIIANIGDWSESYIVDLFDWYLHITERLDWFTGAAQWIFRDFTTPLRPENPLPYVNQKGLVDMSNSPKDAYYVFRSYWSTNPKFCYIESHTWTERSGKPGEKREVNVFSNCSEAELFINGVSQGRVKKDISKFPASGLSWHVLFNEGKNEIKAVGYDDGEKSAEDDMALSYTTKPAGKADDLRLEQERLSNGKYLLTAYAVDKEGKHCLDYNKRVYFTVLSGGKLNENLGTPTGSCVLEMANGKAQIIYEHVPLQKGVIEVRNQDFKGTYITIE